MEEDMTFYDRENPEDSPEVRSGEIRYIGDVKEISKYKLFVGEKNIIKYYIQDYKELE